MWFGRLTWRFAIHLYSRCRLGKTKRKEGFTKLLRSHHSGFPNWMGTAYHGRWFRRANYRKFRLLNQTMLNILQWSFINIDQGSLNYNNAFAIRGGSLQQTSVLRFDMWTNSGRKKDCGLVHQLLEDFGEKNQGTKPGKVLALKVFCVRFGYGGYGHFWKCGQLNFLRTKFQKRTSTLGLWCCKSNCFWEFVRSYPWWIHRTTMHPLDPCPLPSDSATTLACEDFSKSGPRALFCELTSSRYVLTENWLNPKVNPQRLAQRANSAPAFLWQQLRSASLATWLRSRREPRIPIRPMQMIGAQQTFKQNESFLLWSFVPPKFLMDFILT